MQNDCWVVITEPYYKYTLPQQMPNAIAPIENGTLYCYQSIPPPPLYPPPQLTQCSLNMQSISDGLCII